MPSSPTPTTCSVRFLKQIGDGEGAVREFRETIRLDPLSAEAYNSLGQSLSAARDGPGAAEAFANAARLSKVKADSQASVFAVNAGRERLRQNQLSDAIARFREAIGLDPKNAQARFSLVSPCGGAAMLRKRRPS